MDELLEWRSPDDHKTSAMVEIAGFTLIAVVRRSSEQPAFWRIETSGHAVSHEVELLDDLPLRFVKLAAIAGALKRFATLNVQLIDLALRT